MSANPRSAATPAIRSRSRRRSWPRALAGMCLVGLFVGWPAAPASPAVNAAYSCGSAAGTATPPATAAGQSTPTNLTAVAGDAQVILSWSPPSLAREPHETVASYDIWWGTSPSDQFSVAVLNQGTSTSCTVTGLTNGIPYYFVVSAELSAFGVDQGQGPSSNEASATPVAATQPGAPTGLTATAGDSQVTLSWSAPASDGATIAGYDVYQGISPGAESASPVSTSSFAGTSYTVPDLANGTTYYFVVRAVLGSSADTYLGPSSNEVSATPVAAARLGAPTGLTATASDSQVTLSWSAPAGGVPAAGYDVYQGTSPGSESGSPVNTSLFTGTSYTVPDLADGTTYYFTVAAVDGAGHLGPSSGEASATPVAAARLEAPTRLTATAGDSQVTLSWNPPPGGVPAAGYDIYQGTSPGAESGSPVNVSLFHGTTYTVPDLTDGTTYHFTVAAVDGAGRLGPPSNEASATPHGQPPPPPHGSSHPAGWRIGRALPPPSWSLFTWPKVLESLALGALLVVLVGFPAELFNRTYEENEERIRRGLTRMIRWKARKQRSVTPLWAAFIFFAVAAVLTALVEPTFDFGWTGATVFAGFAVAIPVTMAAYAYPAEWYQRRASKITGRFRVITMALLVAALLTVMSRLVHFVPGYVYGLIAGFAATKKPSKSQEAKSVLAGAACVFGLSVVAWILWGKYDAVALGSHASHGEVIIGAVLAQLAILGITSVVFGLMPFKFMDGYRLRAWSRTAWVGVYTVAAFCFALVLIRNNRDVVQNHNPLAAFIEPFILFGVFGLLSVLFWFYFWRHPSPENAAEDRPAHQEIPSGTGGNIPDLTRPGR